MANGIVTATQTLKLGRPFVIRLTGTNEELAMDILQRNGLTAGTDMDGAVNRP